MRMRRRHKLSPYQFAQNTGGPGRTRGPPKGPRVGGRFPEWRGGLTWVLIQNSEWLQAQNNYLLADGSGVY